MSLIKGNIKKALSQWILLPYHFYVRLKKIPGLFKNLSLSKPTNKEFVQEYNTWLKRKSRMGLSSLSSLEGRSWLPKLGVLIVVSSDSVEYLKGTLDAVRDAEYESKEIVLGLNVSNREEAQKLRSVCEILLDEDVKIVDKLAINEASAFNSAFKTGEFDYVMCVKSGDVIEPQCLSVVAHEIINRPSLDVVYFDEGKVNSKGMKHVPYFKPSWSPDLLLSHNYLGYGVFFRASIFKSLGQFDSFYSEAYLFDILLKLTENTENIMHIPEVMFHRKSLLGGVNKIKEEKKAIERALERRNENAKVYVNDERKGTYLVRYKIDDEQKVSIVIPSRDQGEILDNCLASIHEKTTYSNYEIIIVDNGSTESLFFDVIEKWKRKLKAELTVIKENIPFNFSRLNNVAAQQANGDYLLFLNNDVEVLTPDWLTGMVEQAQRTSTGAVGVKLLFPNDEIQHAGVLLGVDGISTHPFAKTPDSESNFYVNNIVNYTALTGACLMVKRSIFEEIGCFDEKYVVEFNDFDLCLRLKSAGLNNIYIPHVVLYHYESYSRGAKHKDVQGFMRYRKERDMFLDQWGEYIENDPSYNPNLHRDSNQIFEPKLD